MRVTSKIFALALLAVFVALGTGCGGPSDSPPKPLSTRFDDMYIAQIPLEQKQAVVQTQNDWSVAKMENAKAEADLNEVSSQLTVVKNDQKAAKLSIDSAISNKKLAESSADTNKINAAQKELRAAELGQRAADARVKYYEAYRDYLKKHHRYTQENMYWREAQYELAKAQLAQKNNVSPKGVDYNWFPKQEADRNKRAASARQKAEDEKKKALSQRDAWLQQQAAADKENGRSTSFPDPMAPKPAATAGDTTSTPVAPAPAPTE
jgi:hypothetical protein